MIFELLKPGGDLIVSISDSVESVALSQDKKMFEAAGFFLAKKNEVDREKEEFGTECVILLVFRKLTGKK